MGDTRLPWLTRRAVLLGGLAYLVFVVAVGVVRKLGGETMIFGSFWEAGRAANIGANPYLNHPLVFAPRGSLGIYETNLNSPAILPLFQIFALLPPALGAALWTGLSGALHAACVLLLNRRLALSRIQLAWLLLPPIVINNFNLGQIYTLLLCLAVGIWLALRADRTALAGVLLGILVALKPNFALCGVALFVAGYHRAPIIAAAVAAALTLVPALLYGPEIYQQWLAAVALDRHGELFPNEISLNGFVSRAGLRAPAGLVLAGLVALGGLALVWRQKPAPDLAAATGLWLGIVCAPLAWTYYLVVVMPFVVARPWSGTMILAAVMTAIPPSYGHAIMGQPGPTVAFGALYLAPVLLLGWHLFGEAGQTPDPPRTVEAGRAPS